jgi:SAM-dependent methyltransferase
MSGPPVGVGSAMSEPIRVGPAIHHMFGSVNSEIAPDQRSLRLLDVGSGNGQLLAFLSQMLARHRPELDFQPYGFDVSDSGVQEVGYLDQAVEFLSAQAPSIPWRERIRMLTSHDRWPYEDGSFDLVVSNHVIEHVSDLDFVFSEIRRVLKDGGVSLHLFPLGHYVYEGHFFMPFVHWFKDHDAIRGFARMASRWGWGLYRRERKLGSQEDLDHYAERLADFLVHDCNYMTHGQVLDLAKRHHLRCSFRHTEHFYTNKLRLLFNRTPRYHFDPPRHALLHSALVMLLMWISSITVRLEKKYIYREVAGALDR